MQERKRLTEVFLHQHKIPTLDSLPYIEDVEQTQFRSPDIVAKKAIVLRVLIDVANGVVHVHDAIEYLKKYDLWPLVSGNEILFLENKQRTSSDIFPMKWRIENLNVLIWALGYPAELPFPTTTCSYVFLEVLPAFNQNPQPWLERAKYRNLDDIVRELDLTYRMHWALVDALENGRTPPAGIRISIVYERHFALNWITMYDEDWDSITTDT